MSVLKKILVSTFLIALIASTISAENIGFVSIKNNVQLEVVKQVLPFAYTRNENKFLVSFSDSDQALLKQAGIEFEVLLSDVNLSEYSLVLPPDKPIEIGFALDKLGSFLDLGGDLHLTNMSQTMSMATSEEAGYIYIPLTDNEIRFTYIPETVSGLLEILDFPHDSLAGLVSLDSIITMNTRLEAFETRYIGTDSLIAARDWIVQKFLNWGYTDVSTPAFSYYTDTYHNVMAVKLGYAEPDKVIVIGGHYDSITYGQPLGPLVYAPGSDDNGSGTTAVLELARILANIPTRKTIIFMPFSAEEVGLIGSGAAAKSFVADSVDVEVMYNFDMVGFTDDNIWDINLMAGSVDGFLQVSADAAERVTSLLPNTVGLRGSSDHWSFYTQGFNLCYAAEGDFNTLGWHTELDLTSRMNFPYLTDVVKMSAAALGVVANSASPTKIENIADVGDGQSLEVVWTDCNPSYDYTVYYGASADALFDSVVVPSGNCSQVVNGLTEGQRYYFSVVGTTADAYPPVYAIVDNGVSYLIPRPPINMNAHAEPDAIRLTWQKTVVNDLSHYRIYKDDGTELKLFADNVPDTFFVDTDVVSQKEYTYLVTAVDFDLNESNNSNKTSAYAATFDAGILLVDECRLGIAGMPHQDEQEAYFKSIFMNQPYDFHELNDIGDRLQQNSIGRYSSIFYLDDDPSSELNNNSIPLNWYLSYSTNIFFSAYLGISLRENSPINSGNLMDIAFGLESYEFDLGAGGFIGATGENGFPSVEADVSNMLTMFVPVIQGKDGVEVIYRYDSAGDNPAFEGKPCGILYDTPQGKRIFLAFALSSLTTESAQNIINHVVSLFGENITQVPGDLDNSGILNIADIVYMVDFMFRTNTSPLDINSADVDGSCQVDIADLVYLVKYLYGSPTGAAPINGCVN